MKNRSNDSSLKRGFHFGVHPSAWYIEGSHLISIAKQIAGKIQGVHKVSSFSPKPNDFSQDWHRGGETLLEQEKVNMTKLTLDLYSEDNERVVEIELEDNTKFLLSLPPSKSPEQISIVYEQNNNQKIELTRLEDRPMEQCVSASVDFFQGKLFLPEVLFHDGVAINNTLHDICEAESRI